MISSQYRKCCTIFILLTLFLSPSMAAQQSKSFLGFHWLDIHQSTIFFHINNRSQLTFLPSIIESLVRYYNVLEASYELFHGEAQVTMNVIKILDNIFDIYHVKPKKLCNDKTLVMYVLLEEISLASRWKIPQCYLSFIFPDVTM